MPDQTERDPKVLDTIRRVLEYVRYNDEGAEFVYDVIDSKPHWQRRADLVLADHEGLAAQIELLQAIQVEADMTMIAGTPTDEQEDRLGYLRYYRRRAEALGVKPFHDDNTPGT